MNIKEYIQQLEGYGVRLQLLAGSSSDTALYKAFGGAEINDNAYLGLVFIYVGEDGNIEVFRQTPSNTVEGDAKFIINA